ncbi:hypothetical protein P8935_02430 [Telmatobacter sp. DSM 110680]|uniref:Uncharacterized protein n=1 Tax=Telmatobacter sp. DSM 110680 TaxID=3036704 RepID=A0AAU7DMB4_9BACT
MTRRTIVDGLILCVMAITTLEICTSQSSPEEKEGKNVSWKTGLPANAKLHEMTSEEMTKYDRDAAAKAEIKAGPVIHAKMRGIEAIDPEKFKRLQQQKLAIAELKLHAATPLPTAQPSSQTGSLNGAQMIAARQGIQSPSGAQTALLSPVVAPATGAASISTVPAAGPMLLPAQPGSSPSTLMSASGSRGGSPVGLGVASTSTIATAPKSKLGVPAPITTIPYVCQTPTIFDVNKQTKNAVFTPELEYDSYVIRGCMFGKQPGQIYLVGKFNAQQVNLQPQFWSDTEIDARVDPKTSGEQDQQNVTLIVAPAGAGQIKMTGFDFVAARSNPAVQLNSIPQNWVTHSGWSENFGQPNLDFQSPVIPGSNAPNSMAGYSVYILRSASKKFSPGTDFYTPQLASGWTFDSVQMTSIGTPPSCPGVVTYKESFGFSEANMEPMTPDWTKVQRNAVRVDGTDTSCSGFIPIAPPFVYWTYSNVTGSSYGLKIWAKGPRCTDPYTGLPQAQCMQNMQQCGTETCGN